MQKKAIIIANQDPDLPGVSKDITNIKSFLMDIVGGAWNESEIKVCINPTLSYLKLLLGVHRLTKYDYMMVFFTGHGGYIRNQTCVQINNNNELIEQSQLENLCPKQINIYDCCRNEIEELKESQTKFSAEAFDSANSQLLSRLQARNLYESQIQQAKPQQLILYSCSLNEYSQDYVSGALYLTNLLKDARKFDNARFYEKRFKLALESHLNAAEIVKVTNRDRNNPQNPDYSSVRFSSVDDKLIISINPVKYISPRNIPM